MNSQLLGKIGEYIAQEFLKMRGYLVWRPDDFIKLLEVAVVYSVVNGKCDGEPKEPLVIAIPTPVGHIAITYWRGGCLPGGGRAATPLESSIYAPCVKKCIEETFGSLLDPLKSFATELLAYREALKTIDLFAYKDGVFYAVEVKTNSGKLRDSQVEKAVILKKWLKPLVVRVYLQNPLVEIKQQ